MLEDALYEVALAHGCPQASNPTSGNPIVMFGLGIFGTKPIGMASLEFCWNNFSHRGTT